VTAVVMIFLVFVAGVAQSTIPGLAPAGHARAPLLLGVVLYYALLRGQGSALLAALLAGMFQDGLSLVPFGYSSFCFFVVVLVVVLFREAVFQESVVTTAFFGGVSAVMVGIGLHILLWKEGLVHPGAARIAVRMAGDAVLGMISTPLVVAIAIRVDRLVGNVMPRKEDVSGDFRYV
jgi:rod shape-determining protein MreD